eukprot:NODE_358_length_8800_cov_0.946673.p2 type:complete len:307 gc:universal NODE_358_length_8800_cov_0.946673:6473-5553(-)
MRIYISRITNPFYNLAMENFIFKSEKSKRVLLIYINEPCVVIGRNQNPFVECNVNYLIDNNIPLLRRYSGGGTVYHDLGNLNYSLMTPKDEFSRVKGVELLKGALETIGLATKISERHDLQIEIGKSIKKISGSAFKLTSQRCYHHGTLLCQSNLDYLRKAINAPELGIDSSAKTSVPMSVANISISTDKIVETIVNYCKNRYPERLDELEDSTELNESQFSHPEVEEYVSELSSFDWIYGKTPKFKIEMKYANKSTKLDVRNLEILKSSNQLIKLGSCMTDLDTQAIENSALKSVIFNLQKLQKY